MWEKLLIKLIPLAINAASPAIKQAACDFVGTLEQKAKTTTNPWDDIVVQILKGILCQK